MAISMPENRSQLDAPYLLISFFPPAAWSDLQQGAGVCVVPTDTGLSGGCPQSGPVEGKEKRDIIG